MPNIETRSKEYSKSINIRIKNGRRVINSRNTNSTALKPVKITPLQQQTDKNLMFINPAPTTLSQPPLSIYAYPWKWQGKLVWSEPHSWWWWGGIQERQQYWQIHYRLRCHPSFFTLLLNQFEMAAKPIQHPKRNPFNGNIFEQEIIMFLSCSIYNPIKNQNKTKHETTTRILFRYYYYNPKKQKKHFAQI